MEHELYIENEQGEFVPVEIEYVMGIPFFPIGSELWHTTEEDGIDTEAAEFLAVIPADGAEEDGDGEDEEDGQSPDDEVMCEYAPQPSPRWCPDEEEDGEQHGPPGDVQ